MHNSHGHEHSGAGVNDSGKIEVQSSYHKEGAAWELDRHHPVVMALRELALEEQLPTRFLYSSGNRKSESSASARADIVRRFLEDDEVQREIKEKNLKSLNQRIAELKVRLKNVD